jgi:hypothetical protein
VVEQTTVNANEPTAEASSVPSVSLTEAIDDQVGIYYHDGEKGTVSIEGDNVIFESNTRIIELGNKEDLSNANLEEFGIAKEEELDNPRE